MRDLGIISVVFVLLGCGNGKKASDEPDQLPIDTEPNYALIHNEAVARVQAKFLDRNEVVSIKPDGSTAHHGDSLLWSGIYIASVKCDQARATEHTLQRAILTHGGQLWRHYSIDDASIDGAIGLFRGIAERYALGCPSFKSWRPALLALRAYADANHGAINEHSSAGLDAFGYTLDLLLDRTAGGDSRDYLGDRRDLLASLMASWARVVNLGYQAWKAGIAKAPPAAYRVHLAFQTLRTLERLGVTIPDKSRDAFCHHSHGMDLPTTDHYCGRHHIKEWLESFKFNEWEFRHQRAGTWETPDGRGYQTPAIDLLNGIATGYTL